MQSKKSQRGRGSGSRRVPSQPPRRRALWPWLLLAALVIVAGAITTRLMMKSRSGPRIENTQVSIDPNFEATPLPGDAAWDPSWPELPQSENPARPIEVVRAAYAYAVRREDVLRHMPCYCGCERQGHHSNHDCFVRGKTAAGAPAWDAMGYT